MRSPAKLWTIVDWFAPAVMALRAGGHPVGEPEAITDSMNLHSMTPASETHTHYFACNTRSLQCRRCRVQRLSARPIAPCLPGRGQADGRGCSAQYGDNRSMVAASRDVAERRRRGFGSPSAGQIDRRRGGRVMVQQRRAGGYSPGHPRYFFARYCQCLRSSRSRLRFRSCSRISPRSLAVRFSSLRR